MYKLLTFALALVIVSSLAVPIFADSFNEKYSDCTVLDGFVTNLDDSVGLAKECLNDIHNPPTIPGAGELTLLEITEYCLQFNADPTLEKNCINDYVTIEEDHFAHILVFVGIVLVMIGAGFSAYGLIVLKNIFYLGLAIIISAMFFAVFVPIIILWRFPPLV